MSLNSANKYLFTLYRRLAIKFDQYLQHLCVVSNIDECKHIFSNNSSTILGSKKFGIHFCKPANISELFDGKVGEMTSERVTAYFGNAIGCNILQEVEYMEFKCESICNLITYPDNLPQLYEDIPSNTIQADAVVKIKDIITYYRDFYQYLAKKYHCYSEKSYDDYCKTNCCSESVKYCCERKKSGCEKQCCCTSSNNHCNNSGYKSNCQIECKMNCNIECKCNNSCHKKSNDCGNNWMHRKC